MKSLRRKTSSPRTTLLESSFAIEMNDLGAEISFSSDGDLVLEEEDDDDLQEISLGTPIKTRRQLQSLKSLVDVEVTPSPMRKPQRPSIETPSPSKCCGIVTTSPPCGRYEEDHPQSAALQSKIHNFLKSPVSVDCWFHGWQVWSVGHQIQEDENNENELKSQVQRVLRNRAFYAKDKKHHLAELKRDLNLQQPKALVKATSYHPTTTTHKLVDDRPPTRSSASSSPILWSCDYDCTENTTVEAPAPVCYDSDPEEYQIRRSLTRISISHDYTIPHDLYDEDAVAECMSHIMNDEWSLLLHKDCQGNVSQRQPAYVAVRAWMDRGQHLDTTTLSPRFAWRPKVLKKKLSERSDTYGVDLLDVHRVLEIEKIDRLRYPFAKKSNIFVLKTINDESYMFEAKSPEERDRIVKALRLVVARFASKLLTRHPDMHEFFSSGHVHATNHLTFDQIEL